MATHELAMESHQLLMNPEPFQLYPGSHQPLLSSVDFQLYLETFFQLPETAQPPIGSHQPPMAFGPLSYQPPINQDVMKSQPLTPSAHPTTSPDIYADLHHAIQIQDDGIKKAEREKQENIERRKIKMQEMQGDIRRIRKKMEETRGQDLTVEVDAEIMVGELQVLKIRYAKAIITRQISGTR